MTPDYWIKFLAKNSLVNKYANIPKGADLSELDGGSIIFKCEKDIVAEAINFYPGIAVLRFGFIPVADCAHGSGDPYFINKNDGENGPIYRIYHDAAWVDDDTYDMEEAINIVLKDYQEILKYVRSE